VFHGSSDSTAMTHWAADEGEPAREGWLARRTGDASGTREGGGVSNRVGIVVMGSTAGEPRRAHGWARRWAALGGLAWVLGCGGPGATIRSTRPDDVLVSSRAAGDPHPFAHGPATWPAALGPSDDLDPWLRRVLDPTAFEPLPPPRPGSWRHRVHEPSQSFADFAAARFDRPDAARSTLVLLPLGSFPTEFVLEDGSVHAVRTPELAELQGFAAAFFGLPVDVITPIPIEPLELPVRERPSHARYDALGIIDAVAPVLPAHAHSMIVLINHDLSVGPEQGYGFGYATHTERLAVMSFARLDPRRSGSAPGTDVERVSHARGYKLLAHELAHTFGLHHCDHFACVMNGVADAQELDDLPLQLCPVCLRKLMLAVGFDPEARYRALHAFYVEQDMQAEAAWVQQRLAEIGGTGVFERAARDLG
jgi:archaemetzincin